MGDYWDQKPVNTPKITAKTSVFKDNIEKTQYKPIAFGNDGEIPDDNYTGPTVNPDGTINWNLEEFDLDAEF